MGMQVELKVGKCESGHGHDGHDGKDRQNFGRGPTPGGRPTPCHCFFVKIFWLFCSNKQSPNCV